MGRKTSKLKKKRERRIRKHIFVTLFITTSSYVITNSLILTLSFINVMTKDVVLLGMRGMSTKNTNAKVGYSVL